MSWGRSGDAAFCSSVFSGNSRCRSRHRGACVRVHGAGDPAHAGGAFRELLHVRPAAVHRGSDGDAGDCRLAMGAARVAPGGQPCGADDRGAFGAGFHGIASLCAAGGRWRDARRAHDVSSEHRHARGALGRTARFAGRPSRWVCGRAFLHAVGRSDFGFGVFLKWGGPCVVGHVALACRRAFCCVSASGCRRGGEKRCGRGWVAAIASAVCMLVGERPRSRCRPGDSAFGVPRAHGDVPVVVDGVARGCRHVLSFRLP